MSPEQKAAYVNSQVACAMIEALGMQAQNLAALHQGGGVKYLKDDFDELLNKYGIHHNAVHDYTV